MLELGQFPRLPPPLGLLRATSAGRHPAGLHQGRQYGQGEKLLRPLLHLQPLQRLPSAQGLNTISRKTDGTYGNVRFQQQKWEDTRSVQLRLTYRFNQAKKQYRGENSAQEAVGRMGGK